MGKRTRYITDERPLSRKKNFIEEDEDVDQYGMSEENYGMNDESVDVPQVIDKLDKKVIQDYLDQDKEPYRRPITKFKTEFSQQVYFLAKGGFKTEQIAEFFKVSEPTINNWKIANPEFYEAYRAGAWNHSFNLLEAMDKSAYGYNYVEIEKGQTVTRSGKVVPTTKIIHKHKPPSEVLLMFILKNKYPEIWGDLNGKAQAGALSQHELAKKIDTSSFSEQEKALLKSIAIKKAKEMQGQTAK